MALRLLWFPSSILSGEQHSRTSLLPQNPCQTKISLSLSSSSHFSKDIFHSRRKTTRTDLIVFQISSMTQLQSSFSSSTVDSPESDSESEIRTRLIAQNVPWTSTDEDIRNLFAQYGTVKDVELSMHNKTKNRGLAFITMGSEEEALAALNNLESYEFEGRVLKINYAHAQKKKSSAAPLEPLSKHNVFVGNLPFKARSKDLREFFSSGSLNVVSAQVIFESDPRKSTGYGFVSFVSKEEAEAAVSGFNGKKLMGRPIRLARRRMKLEEESRVNAQIEETFSEVNSNGELSDKTAEM